MHLIKQKINWPAVTGQIGLLLHVPAAMAAVTLIIAILFQEWFALLPFGTIAISALILGQAAFQPNKKARPAHLWDAMIIAGFSWLVCSFFAAIPFYWISHI